MKLMMAVQTRQEPECVFRWDSPDLSIAMRQVDCDGDYIHVHDAQTLYLIRCLALREARAEEEARRVARERRPMIDADSE
jgi:hypothetical protein